MVGPGELNSVEQDPLVDNGPAEFPALQPTGDASVDEVLQRLTAVPGLGEADQPAVYERLHDSLLSELNTEHR